MVVLSQDMLSYEPGVMQYFGYGLARIRLLAILFIQNATFRHAQGVIFLTKYASKLIQKSSGSLKSIAYIPHGVDAQFYKKLDIYKIKHGYHKQIRCIYISNAEMYKHQWVVVKAISILRKQGYDVVLALVGGGKGPALELINDAIKSEDPNSLFIEQLAFLPHKELPDLLASSDLSIFASSCENMPVTLLESMAVGIPIACSDRGPMPEVLESGGVYFNPENAESIAAAIEKIILDDQLREGIVKRAKELAEHYSWERCSKETFSFVVKTFNIK
jgi:glycosyltransferase involved in cell wall biosynthesis